MPNAYWKDKASWRKWPRPKGWKATRKRIIARDGGVCQWSMDAQGTTRCGQPATDVDHIVPVFTANSEAELERLEQDHNLRLLCTTHHRRKTSSDAGKASAASRPTRSRPRERHPGLIDPENT
ncbi:MAG TPA: HNH endonuclease signature motif containing protein [Spirillospora sp.]|nr:HNH endonuclease signature motif containing protein [Spirillospora sp.]